MKSEIEEYLHQLAEESKSEEAYIVFPNGKVLHRCCESANPVSLSGLDLRGADIYHNHPSDEGINEVDIFTAYNKGARSITAICPQFKDVVIFRNGKRIQIDDDFCNHLQFKAMETMNSKEYDALKS